jgi:hypothetical protein
MSTPPGILYIAIGFSSNNNFEPIINNYDNTGLFAIGYYMFLFGFALVSFVLLLSNFEYKDEPSPLSLPINAKRILLSVGVIVAILGLITSLVRWMIIAKI